MRYAAFVAIFLPSLVAGQASYPELPSQYLLTTTPVTPLPQGFPWGPKTANNTNVCKFFLIVTLLAHLTNFSPDNPPHTGVIRAYDFTITRGWAAPDGYYKDVMMVNNQFPGPLIEANWGDTIQVTIHNAITAPEEGTALHWHGILQKDMQWMDGVPGVQQCPIAPGGSFTYSFLADLYGTTWYHSHYSGQYAGGVIGPMVIHGPSTVAYDIDIGPIILTDHYHREYFDIVKDTMSTDINKVIQLSDNNLINGRNNFNCSTVATGDTRQCFSNAATSKFRFYSGKVHRLRLINAGAEATLLFSIDGHTMKVIANDFVPIIPYDTKVVTLGVGQRTDVLVQAQAGTPGPFVMRSTISACSLFVQPAAKAMVYYRTQDAAAAMPNTSPWPEFTTAVANAACGNDPLISTRPWFPITPAATPSTTQEFNIGFGQNASGHWVWTIQGSSFRVNYNQPVLLLSKTGNNSFPTNWNGYNFGSNSTVRLHVKNPGFAAHPMHLHGHNFWVLAEGTGTWDGTVVNAANPQRRDVQIVRAGGYLVIQINQDNPGTWPFHCHIAWHVSGGLYVTVIERPADIAKLPIPAIMAQSCRDWAAYTNTTVVDQIDSGL
ncbi:probable laccase precursor [Rhynchosporium agropyri]|uniref:Probable laccase n=1 Tax=Rhynchosporium agropyri TaxID=914238 RepID=A0A1E1KYW0_9HELO|nr:probable laccase precursor [Rhynchosporium agropyri]